MIRQAINSDFQAVNLIDPFSGDRREDIEEGRVYISIKEGFLSGFISMSRAGLLGRPYIQYSAVVSRIVTNYSTEYRLGCGCGVRLYFSFRGGKSHGGWLSP